MYVAFYEADQRMTRAANRKAAEARLAAEDEALAAFEAYWDAAYAEQEAQRSASDE